MEYKNQPEHEIKILAKTFYQIRTDVIAKIMLDQVILPKGKNQSV